MKLTHDEKNSIAQAVKPISTEKLTIGGTAATAAAFSVETNDGVIRLCADVACFYAFNEDATTSSVYLPASAIEYVKIGKGDTLSVITGGTSGSIYISEAE